MPYKIAESKKRKFFKHKRRFLMYDLMMSDFHFQIFKSSNSQFIYSVLKLFTGFAIAALSLFENVIYKTDELTITDILTENNFIAIVIQYRKISYQIFSVADWRFNNGFIFYKSPIFIYILHKNKYA